MESIARFEDCDSDKQVHEKLQKILCSEYLNPNAEKCKVDFEKFKLDSEKIKPPKSSVDTPEQILEWLNDREELGEEGIGPGQYATLRKLTEELDGDISHLITAAEEKMKALKEVNGNLPQETSKIIQITLLDGSAKKLQVEEGQTVSEIVQSLCEKIGLANYEEYSLVVDFPEEYKERTLIMKKEKSIAKDEEKLDKMRRKLHTDDEIDWLDHNKTLNEQGVNDDMTLILRKKFFYSDRNVDQRDPVQLNLLYVQSRDSILKGTHIVSLDQAVEFAALQCQIQYGIYDETKHKAGFLWDLKDFLPEEFAKRKDMELKIFEKHSKLRDLNEINAKVRYTRKCRGLKTYGITTFLVKEKLPGKNKLVPVLLGITRSSVVRMDDKSKEILKSWPLTAVRKWAASPNSFILDFGDYSDSNYSVQTQEGEQIANLISGYIDIILKRKKGRDYMGSDGNEEFAVYEDSVTPGQATTMQGSVLMGRPQQQKLSKPQQALFREGAMSVQNAESHMDKGFNLPQLGNDTASNRWKENAENVSKEKLSSHLSSLNAATAKLVTLWIDPKIDTNSVGLALNQVSSNITNFSRDMAMLLSLLEDGDENKDQLLGATKKLCSAFSELLNAAQTRSGKEKMFSAAKAIGETITTVMDCIGHSTGSDGKAFQDTLLALAEAVSDPTSDLVEMVKDIADGIDDEDSQIMVIEAADDCENAVTKLMATTKVLMPMIGTQACQDQLRAGVTGVASSIEGILEAIRQTYGDEGVSSGLSSAVSEVSKALSDLLKHIKKGPGAGKDLSPQEATIDAVLKAAEKFSRCLGDGREMVKTAKSLSKATSVFEKLMIKQAESVKDSDTQRRFLDAAKKLADATRKMLEAAQACEANPNDPKLQENLKVAAENLMAVVKATNSSVVTQQIIKRLETAGKKAVAASTTLMNAAGAANRTNSNTTSKAQLKLYAADLNEYMADLVRSLKGFENDRDSVTTQLTLLHSSKKFITPGETVVSACKSASPTVGDKSAAENLKQSMETMTTVLEEMKSALALAEGLYQTLDVDGALSMLGQLDKELSECSREVADGKLIPLPGDSAETCALKLGTASKNVGSSVAKLLRSNSKGDGSNVGVVSHDSVNSLRSLIEAARGVAATSTDKSLQNRLIQSAQDVADKLRQLLEETNKMAKDPSQTPDMQRFNQLGQAVSTSLNRCVSSLPGLVVVDSIIQQITDSVKAVSTAQLPSSEKSLEELQKDIDSTASEFTTTAGNIVSVSRGLPQLAQVSNRYISTYNTFINTGLMVAGKSSDPSVQEKIVTEVKGVSQFSSKLLLAAKGFSADPNAPNAKGYLQESARAVADSINRLINACLEQTPEQRECDNAERHMQMMKAMLENASESMSQLSYFECLDQVIEKTQVLNDSVSGMSTHGKKHETEPFCASVQSFTGAVSSLTESSSQAAYLVAISDSASEPGKPGLLDHSHFVHANQAVQTVCKRLVNLTTPQDQVVSEAKKVTKYTTDLCKACRTAATKTTDPQTKKQFEQSTSEMSEHIKNLVKHLKELGSNFSAENQQLCAAAARPLMQAVDNITAYAASPEFASIPAKISPQAKKAQEPILTAGQTVVDNACRLMHVAKTLAVNPSEKSNLQLYTEQSKKVTSAIKVLLSSVRMGAPGQKECEEAIDRMTTYIRSLEQADMAAISQKLPPRKDNTVSGFQNLMISRIKEIQSLMVEVRQAAKSDAEKLGQKVLVLSSHFEPLSDSAIGCISLSANTQTETPVLDLTKTVAESTQQFLYACKDGSGNPKATHTHETIDTAAKDTAEVLQDLLKTLEESASQAGMVDRMVEKLNAAIAEVIKKVGINEGMSYQDYQSQMVNLVKKIAQTAQDMTTKAGTSPGELGPQSEMLTADYEKLAGLTAGVTVVVSSAEISKNIQSAVQDLGKGCIELVNSASKVQGNPQDAKSRQDLASRARAVKSCVGRVLASLQAGFKGTEACMNAITDIGGVITDLETTIMFANARSLTPEEGKVFVDYRQSILEASKVVSKETDALAGAASNQEQLVVAAEQSVICVTKLADVVKLGAGSLGTDHADAQVLLVSAVKDVASAMSDFLNALKTSSEKSKGDIEMVKLKQEDTKTKVASLVKTIETIEDEATRGTRALETTIEAIKEKIKAFENGTLPVKEASAEDLIRLTKPVTTATTKAVSAGNSGRQEDVMVCANTSRKAIFDLLEACKGAANTAETEDVKGRTMQSGQKCAKAYKNLLEQVIQVIQKPTPDGKSKLGELSRSVANTVTELVQSAQAIKGSDWVNPEDPTVIAENELLEAAKSIEAAAAKLALLKPKRKAKDADMNLKFEEHILEATKSIAAATAALVKSASVAQKELVAEGRIRTKEEMKTAYNKSEMFDQDGQWSEGLISAARMVARATENLCEAANALVQGIAKEERLIASAKEVASSTVALVMACKVKASPFSESMQGLQDAGHKVKEATDMLVKEAQQFKREEEPENIVVSKKTVGGMVQLDFLHTINDTNFKLLETSSDLRDMFLNKILQEMSAMEDLIRKEKEVEKARAMLAKIRKEKYKN